ncbi:acyl-CoA dehydrogenase family protein [Paenibacillus piri]|uniref:Acyl-CoA dehydrogenase n=1 Tax=Paenibacillus piri TaxID=2547395 RepID=A0A4R5KQ59_9BACL|nr:acyl-CoA dehydrogenase family protein [Paenibacillus piri]TDF97098.1 acyl-CoA dehydrogenase [Paenibacillus piri]
MASSIAADRFIRNDKEAEIASRSERLAAVFAERAAKHDEEGTFPFENFADLRQDGYLKLTVPKRYGGEEASLYELVLAQERLARGDGSTALAVGWHIGLMLQYRYTHPWPEALYASFCREVVRDGAMINAFASERATGSPSRGGRPETIAVKTDGGWLISGRKTFSTLSPILKHFTVSAAIAGGDETGDFFVRKGPGVRVEETWSTIGMRATGSHDLILERVFVPDGELISRSGPDFPPRKADDGGGWLLHIPACYIGIAWAARDFAVRFARQYRPNSLPGPISELPHIQQKIGQMEADLITARTLLYAVADRWDSRPEGRIGLKPELGLAKYIATNHAIGIVDQAMRIVGGASLSRTLPLERMYRDVRAGLHNPPMDDAVLRGLALRALAEE